MKRSVLTLCALAAMLPAIVASQSHPQPHHGGKPMSAADLAKLAEEDARTAKDARIAVEFPAPVKQAMLERMRRQLADLHQIQQALSESNYERAVAVAENSLGLSSLGPHNARQAPYMPDAMQHLGMQMHSASSRFAVAAQEGDLAKALGRLSEVTGYCVACHATYRAK